MENPSPKGQPIMDWWHCRKEQVDRSESSLRKGWWTSVEFRVMWAVAEKTKRQQTPFWCSNYCTTNPISECPAQNKQRRCQKKGCGTVDISEAAWSKRSDKTKKQLEIIRKGKSINQANTSQDVLQDSKVSSWGNLRVYMKESSHIPISVPGKGLLTYWGQDAHLGTDP